MVKKQILALVLGFLCLFHLLAVLVLFVLKDRYVRDDFLERQKTALATVQSYLAQQETEISGLLELAGEAVRAPELLRRFDQDEAYARSLDFYRTVNRDFDITHFYFLAPDGTCLLRVHNPHRFGDRIDRLTLKRAAAYGSQAAGLELGPLGSLTLRVVRPVEAQGRRLGFLELGKEIDRLLHHVELHGLDLAVALDKSRLDKQAWTEGQRMLGKRDDWGRYPDMVVAATTTGFPALDLGRALAQAPGGALEIDHRSTRYHVGVLPILDAGNEAVGRYVLVYDAGHFDDEFARMLGVFLAVGLAASLAFVLALSFHLGKVERRLKEAMESLNAEIATSDGVRRELEAFSYSVSHDLRAPLRAMDGYCHILGEDFAGRLGKEGEAVIGSIRKACRNMGRIIDDLLLLSRVSRSEMQREAVDLSALVRDAAAELTAADPGRRVRLQIAPDVRAVGDPALLRPLVANLVGNAWKFSSGREEAVIAFGAAARNGAPVFFVADNGAGFDMRYAAKLFQPFQRLHSAAEFEGTGIGLAIAARIVERHGGRIWAEAEPDRGAKFFFTLGG